MQIHSIANTKYLLPLLLAISIAVVLGQMFLGSVVVVLVIAVILFFSVSITSYRYPRLNMVFLLSVAFLVPFLIKALMLYTIPIGTAIEGLCILLLITLGLNRRLGGLKTLPGILLSTWIGFQIIELLNPIAISREAGFWAVRSLIPMASVYFIVYSSVETKKDFYLLCTAWFVLGALAAAYGLYQEFFGLPSHDLLWASYDIRRYELLFTWGRMRKFSFFFSPSEFGMLMAITGVAGLVVAFFAKKYSMRILSGVTAALCLWAMLYTGSRTAMILIPVGLCLFAAVTLDKKVLIGVGILAVLGAGMVLKGSSNKALFVMSTAFSAKEDPSMRVRLANQKLIQSYIRSHPVGFGLGSTGDLGMKYTPQTFIGSFPPDSEYVKIAIETGWLGLLIWCIILARIFAYCVKVYFIINEPEWKMIITFVIVVFFMIIVAQYPQEYFRSQVLTMIFATSLGLMAKINTKFSGSKSNID